MAIIYEDDEANLVSSNGNTRVSLIIRNCYPSGTPEFTPGF